MEDGTGIGGSIGGDPRILPARTDAHGGTDAATMLRRGTTTAARTGAYGSPRNFVLRWPRRAGPTARPSAASIPIQESRMPRTRILVGAVALALAASSAHAQRFSGVVTFGDSLSDGGNIGLAPAAAGGLGGAFGASQSFTTNPDPVLVEILALRFGSTLAPSLAGGRNFAWGGACALPASASPCQNNPNPVTRLDAQIGQYLGAGTAVPNPNALHTVWMGANDLFQRIPVWGLTLPAAQAQAAAQTQPVPVATAVVQQVGRLQAAGARNIMVLNLPDLGVTPQFSTGPAAALSPLATLATLTYNGALSQGLSQLGTGIIPINVFGLVNDVRANPAAFGFTNVTGTACGAASSLVCGPGQLAAAGANQTWLFADGVHPTGGAHALLANVAFATIEAPAIVSLAPETAIAAYDDHSRSVAGALFEEYGLDREDGTVRGYAVVTGSNGSLAGSATSPGADATGFNATVGATYKVNQTFSFGLAAGIGNQNLDPVGGTIDANTALLSGYATLDFGGFYAHALVSGGSSPADIARTIELRASTRIENGETDIDQTAAELTVGYVFKGEHLQHGPFVGVAWQEATVAAYAEDAASATSMNFAEFTRESLVTRAGYQLRADFDAIKPFVRVAWNQEDETDASIVNAGSNSMGGRFNTVGFAPGEEWTSADVGLGFALGENLDGQVSYSGRFGDDVVDRDSVNLGLSLRF